MSAAVGAPRLLPLAPVATRNLFLPASPIHLAGTPLVVPRQYGRLVARRRLPGSRPPQAAVSARTQGTFDPELRSVLELATATELFELEDILFGASYVSPLLKSISSRPDVDHFMVGEDIEGREDFIAHLESRFLFLAADAGSTLRGWRPSYRNVLLAVRRKMSIPCSSRLSTEDLEGEIFLQLLQEYSSSDPWDNIKYSSNSGTLEAGLNPLKVHGLVALRAGAKGLQHMVLKGGCVLALTKIYRLLSRKLPGKMLLQATNHELKHEIINRGLAHAVLRGLGVKSLTMLLGPVLWGTFVADVVMQMLGTDYARILRAIYAFAQIRLYRTYGWTSNKDQ